MTIVTASMGKINRLVHPLQPPFTTTGRNQQSQPTIATNNHNQQSSNATRKRERDQMVPQDLHVDHNWDWDSEDLSKPAAQRFFEGYAHAVNTRTFGQGSMTKWYSSKVTYRSETGKVFYSADEMKAWMSELFFSFEKINHVPERYLQYTEGDIFRVHAGFLRQFWLKGNTGDRPDTDTPMSWVCEIGPADESDGYLGLQFKKVSLYWDKTKTVELLKTVLPSDR